MLTSVTMSFLDTDPITFAAYTSVPDEAPTTISVESINAVHYYQAKPNNSVTITVSDFEVGEHDFSAYVGRQLQRQMDFFDKDTKLPYRFEMVIDGVGLFSGCFMREVNYDSMDHSMTSPLTITIGVTYNSRLEIVSELDDSQI